MSRPTGDNEFEVEFEAEIEVELSLTESSDAGWVAGLPVAEWAFDPADAEREEIGLRNLLGAARELEHGSRPDTPER
ncbi:hypothetical protein AB0L06_07360 [Spirillospora sp. NPDC052269]